MNKNDVASKTLQHPLIKFAAACLQAIKWPWHFEKQNIS